MLNSVQSIQTIQTPQAGFYDSNNPAYAAIVAFQAHAAYSFSRRGEEPPKYQEVIPEVNGAFSNSFDVLFGLNKRRIPRVFRRKHRTKEEVKHMRPLAEGSIGLIDVLA